MATDPQSLYAELGQLVTETPADLSGDGPISHETHRWLGRACTLVEANAVATRESGAMMDQIAIRSASNSLTDELMRAHFAHEIMAVLHRTLARVELRVPAASRGGFISPAAPFLAMQIVGKVLREAAKELMFVDAYMDATLLTDFATLAAEGVSIKLLADSSSSKSAAIGPAAERWVKEFAAKRPLEVRLSAPRALHDRLIIVDGGTRVWNLSQSWNHLAARSPASLTPFDAEVAQQKLDHYLPVWSASTPL